MQIGENTRRDQQHRTTKLPQPVFVDQATGVESSVVLVIENFY